MTLEESFKALKQAFTGKSAEAEALANEHAKVVAVNAELTAKVSALEAEVAKIESFSKQVEELTAKLSAAEIEKAQAVAQNETAGKKAAVIASSVGVTAVEISPAHEAQANGAKSNAEVWAAYLAETDPAKKTAFYNANRSAIIAHFGIK
jgi:DNA repair exonuclease SbcCD ATPase subunit